MPSAYLGALRGGTTRLLAHPGVTGEQAKRALQSLLDGAEQLARDAGLRSVACLHLPAADHLEREVLAEAGYAEFGPALHVAAPTMPPRPPAARTRPSTAPFCRMTSLIRSGTSAAGGAVAARSMRAWLVIAIQSQRLEAQ
jgi:hypothetical protein